MYLKSPIENIANTIYIVFVWFNLAFLASIGYAQENVSSDRSFSNKIPLCLAIIKTENYSHMINTVLVGDSVLNYNDWHNFDGMNDFHFREGRPNVPNSTFIIGRIYKVDDISLRNFREYRFVEFLRFQFNSKGEPNLVFKNPALITNKEMAIKLIRQNKKILQVFF